MKSIKLIQTMAAIALILLIAGHHFDSNDLKFAGSFTLATTIIWAFVTWFQLITINKRNLKYRIHHEYE